MIAARENGAESHVKKPGWPILLGFCVLAVAFLASSAGEFGTNVLRGAGLALVGLQAALAAWYLRPGNSSFPSPAARWVIYGGTVVAVVLLVLSLFMNPSPFS